MKIVIPKNVKSIDRNMVQYCLKEQHNSILVSKITAVVIPDSITDIGGYAFLGCSSLTRIVIPNSVKSIGKYAFFGCTSLASITIPNSVVNIGDYAFYGCPSLALEI